jgi:hypothetical protein
MTPSVGYGADAADDAGGRRPQSRGAFWAHRIIADSTVEPTGSKVPKDGWFPTPALCPAFCRLPAETTENQTRLASGQKWCKAASHFCPPGSTPPGNRALNRQERDPPSGGTGKSVSSLWIRCDQAMELNFPRRAAHSAAARRQRIPVPAPTTPISPARRPASRVAAAPAASDLAGHIAPNPDHRNAPWTSTSPVATTDVHSVTAIGVSGSGASRTLVTRSPASPARRGVCLTDPVAAGMGRLDRTRGVIRPPGITRRSRFVTITERV